MKKFINPRFLILLVFLMLSAAKISFADDPNPPPFPGGHGLSGDAPAAAPVDNGIWFLVLCSVTYAAWKIRSVKKHKETETENSKA